VWVGVGGGAVVKILVVKCRLAGFSVRKSLL